MKRTVIAAAVAGLCSSSMAFAAGYPTPPDSNTSSVTKHYYENVDVKLKNDAEVELRKKIDVSKKLELDGYVYMSGYIGEIDNASMATVDNKQVRTGNRGQQRRMYNKADSGDHMGMDATGNVQANITSGDGNLQKNVVSIATSEAPSGWSRQTRGFGQQPQSKGQGSADAEVFVMQESAENHGTFSYSGNEAKAGYELFKDLSGNGQLNVSAGSWNGQENVLAISHASNAVLAESTSYSLQQASDNLTMFDGGGNSASIGNRAFSGLSGSGQVNVASGLSNSQNNQLVISTAQAY